MRRVLSVLGWIAAAAGALGIAGAIVLVSGAVEALGCRPGTFLRLSCPDDRAGRIGELLWTSALFFAILLPATAVPMIAVAAPPVARLLRRRRPGEPSPGEPTRL